MYKNRILPLLKVLSVVLLPIFSFNLYSSRRKAPRRRVVKRPLRVVKAYKTHFKGVEISIVVRDTKKQQDMRKYKNRVGLLQKKYLNTLASAEDRRLRKIDLPFFPGKSFRGNDSLLRLVRPICGAVMIFCYKNPEHVSKIRFLVQDTAILDMFKDTLEKLTGRELLPFKAEERSTVRSVTRKKQRVTHRRRSSIVRRRRSTSVVVARKRKPVSRRAVTPASTRRKSTIRTRTIRRSGKKSNRAVSLPRGRRSEREKKRKKMLAAYKSRTTPRSRVTSRRRVRLRGNKVRRKKSTYDN